MFYMKVYAIYFEEMSRTARIVDIKMRFEKKFNVLWVKLDLT